MFLARDFGASKGNHDLSCESESNGSPPPSTS